MTTFERFFAGLGVVCVATALVRCVGGCSGDAVSVGEGLGVSEAGSDDANTQVSDSGDPLREDATDGMAPVPHPDSDTPDACQAPDGARCTTSPPITCDSGSGALCRTTDPGVGVYCHGFGGSYCNQLEAGACPALGSPCLTQAPDPQRGQCPGTVVCAP